MQGFIDIHTHNISEENTIVNFYQDFEQSRTVKHCSLGLHPWYLQNAAQDFETLQQYVHQNNVLAIGECGLDKLSQTDWILQEKYFLKQIDLANSLHKPLIVHCVRAYNECIALLENASVPVIFHGFNRNLNIAQMLLDKGFYLSIGGSIFQESFASAFAALSLEKIFFETDDKEEINIEIVYKRAAEIKNIALETLILQIENNYQKVFTNAR